MLSIQDLQTVIAEGFFEGSETVAGLVMFAAVMLLLLVLVKKKETAIVAMLPVCLIFGTLGIMSMDLMVLLIIVTVLILAFMLRDTWR